MSAIIQQQKTVSTFRSRQISALIVAYALENAAVWIAWYVHDRGHYFNFETGSWDRFIVGFIIFQAIILGCLFGLGFSLVRRAANRGARRFGGLLALTVGALTAVIAVLACLGCLANPSDMNMLIGGVLLLISPILAGPLATCPIIPTGLCAVCSYDLRAHAPGGKCPECGTVIPVKNAMIVAKGGAQ